MMKRVIRENRQIRGNLPKIWQNVDLKYLIFIMFTFYYEEFLLNKYNLENVEKKPEIGYFPDWRWCKDKNCY